MMIALYLVALIISVSQLVESSEKQKVIAVYNSSKEINLKCVQGADFQYTLADLPSTLSSNTFLKICSNLMIERNITLLNISNIYMVGYDYPVLRCPFGADVGLVFANIHNLELHNFTVDGCGLRTDVDADPQHNIKASLTIKTSINITLINITIVNGPGSGLAMFYNNGSIRVENSSFEGNGHDRHTGGNGAYVETGPAVSTDYLANGLTAVYEFIKCRFMHNVAATGMDNIIKGFSRFDKGGGLCIYILASEKLNVTITNALFVGNEAKHYGGGLFVSFIGKSRNNNVLVFNSTLTDNNSTYGGATYNGYLHTRLPFETPLNCSHFYNTVQFTNNSADFGGGSSIFSTKTLANDSSAQVIFENCTWTSNTGQYGSAVTVLPNAWNLYSEGYLPTPRFIGCILKGNIVRSENIHVEGDYSQYSKGSGAFYCFGHNVLFEEVTSFSENKGSAMYLGSCLGIFTESSITTFFNNIGYQGGAIYELSSVIYIHDNATMSFIGNQATDKGGAIYEHTFFMHIYDYSRTCFIDYIDNIKEVSDRNISVEFLYNHAGHSGHSIYASSLRPCYNRFSFSAANLSIDIFDQVGNFTYSPPDRPIEIATAINHSNITDTSWSGQIAFIPGKETKIPFFDVDDLNQNVTTNYLVTIESNKSEKVTTSKYYSEISMQHPSLTWNGT